MQVLNDAWNEILLSSAQRIVSILLYDRYIPCELTGEKRPTHQLQPPTPLGTLCQAGWCLLWLHTSVWANRAGSQLHCFSQEANRKHFLCHGSCFGGKKNIDLMEFLNNYIFLSGICAAWAWIVCTQYSCFFALLIPVETLPVEAGCRQIKALLVRANASVV